MVNFFGFEKYKVKLNHYNGMTKIENVNVVVLHKDNEGKTAGWGVIKLRADE